MTESMEFREKALSGKGGCGESGRRGGGGGGEAGDNEIGGGDSEASMGCHVQLVAYKSGEGSV